MAGIRILEVAEHTFVPAASAVLAEWGAEVIKIEHVERGDAMRGLASTGVMDLGGGVHVLLEHSNRGKKSLAVDIASPEGHAILLKLAATCDVFLTNKTEGVRRRLQIDVDDIRRANPNIVYVRGTGHGAHGPEADRGGYDFLSYWCRAGSASGSMQPDVEDDSPMQPAPAYGDSIGGMTIAGGICAALLHRERTGEALVVDVSLLGVGMWAMGAAVALSQQLGVPWTRPARGTTEIRNPLLGAFKTSDGRWVAINCLQAFRYWPDFCRVIGREDLVDDPRFSTHEALTENAAEAREIVSAWLSARTLAEVKATLADFSGQWAPVQDTLEVVDDPQVLANGYVLETETAAGVPFKLVTSPVQFDERPTQPRRAPQFNEHGDQILVDQLGYDWETLIELKTKGVIA